MSSDSTMNVDSTGSGNHESDADSSPRPGQISRRGLALGGVGAVAATGLASATPAFAKAAEVDPDVADVVIVGAGFSGSLVAGALARRGKSVVVLESGPEREARDLVSSKIWARSLHGPYAGSQGANPIGFGYDVGWGLGGSGTHHFAAWPRMHQLDFELKTRYGRGFDWPIDYDELRPYYDRIQRDIGISGDSDAEVWRPPGDPYPLPPLELQPQARLLRRGFEALGLRTAPTPLAILSRPYKGRPACEYVGWCATGCAIGALAHPLVTLIPEARRFGAEFRTRAHVLRVVMDGERAAGVEYVDAAGARRVQRGRVVIIAAFSLETPRILLNSGDGGVANSSGLVGRYIHPHVLLTIHGLLAERTDPHRGVVGGELICQDDYDPDSGNGFFGGWQWLAGVAVKPNDLGGLAISRPEVSGSDLEPFMRRAATHLATMNGIGFAMPALENGLTLTEELDEYGMPKAVVTHSYDADALKLFETANAQGLEIMRAAGAEEVWSGPILSAHVMGGTMMGNDPADSVVTSYGQTHDVDNLFVTGASTFPVGGAVNPTFTLNALALRSAEFITRNWQQLT
jgi:choline dehydrogenase-like flavoprotein